MEEHIPSGEVRKIIDSIVPAGRDMLVLRRLFRPKFLFPTFFIAVSIQKKSFFVGPLKFIHGEVTLKMCDTMSKRPKKIFYCAKE